MPSTPCRTCAATRDTADLSCPFCAIVARPGAAALKEQQQKAAMLAGDRCDACGSEKAPGAASCPTCERAEERVRVNTESAGPLIVPFVMMLSAGWVLVLKVFPSWNVVPEMDDQQWVSPRFIDPWLVIVGVVVAFWGVAVLVKLQNDQDRWTKRPGTRAAIRNQSWFQVVAGITLVVTAIAI